MTRPSIIYFSIVTTLSKGLSLEISSIKSNFFRFGDFGKSAKIRKFTKNYICSDRMKKSNSRDRDNENQLNFHGDERYVKYTFWCYFEII